MALYWLKICAKKQARPVSINIFSRVVICIDLVFGVFLLIILVMDSGSRGLDPRFRLQGIAFVSEWRSLRWRFEWHRRLCRWADLFPAQSPLNSSGE